MTDMMGITKLLETKDLALVPSPLLGSGYFGEVYKTVHKLDGEFYAIKIIDIPKYISNYPYNPLHKTIFELKKEAKFLAGFNNNHVVSYKDCWFGGPDAKYYRDLEEKDEESQEEGLSSCANVRKAFLCIKMGFCHSNLREWIKNNNTKELRKEHQLDILKQILKGLKYIHSQNVIHRDIKTANILIKDELLIQIGDFGLSTKVNSDASLTSKNGPVGTEIYRSPEMISAKGKGDYNCKTDVYSTGLVFIEILNVDLDSEEKRRNAFKRIRQKCYDFLYENPVKELIKQMTKEDSRKRVSASEALELLRSIDSHEFLKMNDGTLKEDEDDRRISSTSYSLAKNDGAERLIFEDCKPSTSSGRNPNKRPRLKEEETVGNEFTETKSNLQWPISHEIKFSVENFAGREKEIQQLESLFYENKKKLVLICGLGGIGKTELVKIFMNNLVKKDRFSLVKKDVSRVWLHGGTIQSLKNSIVSFAIELGVKNKKASSPQMFKYLAGMTLRHCNKLVVVIDNVDVMFQEVIQIIEMIQVCDKIFVIVTSRDRMILGTAGVRMELDVLSNLESREIFRKSLINVFGFKTDSLYELLGYYPLALQQAVAYIKVQREGDYNTPNYSVANYLSDFNEKKDQMLGHKLNNFDNSYSETTLTTWNLTFDKLTGAATEILGILAFFEPDRIEVNFIEHVCEELGYGEEMGNALNMLRNYCLIKVDKKVISIHRLVQDVMREKVESGFAKKLFDAVGIVSGYGWSNVLEDIGSLHIDIVEDFDTSYMERITQFAYGVEFSLSKFAYDFPLESPSKLVFYIKAGIACELSKLNRHSDCLELCELVLSSNSKHDRTHYYAFRALLITSKTHLSHVIKLLEKILESKKSSLVSQNDEEIILKIKIVLASVLKNGERKSELVREIRNFYDLMNKPKMEKFYTCLFLPNIIGEDWATRDFIYKLAGDFDYDDLELEFSERLLPVYKSLLWKDDELSVRVRNGMPTQLYYKEDYAESFEVLKQVISSNVQTEVKKAYETVDCIATSLYKNGKYIEAKTLFERIVKFYKDEENEEKANDIKPRLAITLLKLNYGLTEAIRLSYGPRGTNGKVRSVNKVAREFYEFKDYAESLKLLEGVISSKIKDEVEKAYKTMNKIAQRFFHNGKYDEAKGLFERVVKFTKEHCTINDAKYNLVQVLALLGCELDYPFEKLCREAILYYNEGEGKYFYDAEYRIERLRTLEHNAIVKECLENMSDCDPAEMIE